ncbi:serine hydrolase domain-containing protein [Erythrobacter crassostreae]|uniref:Beta-lactamase family protein n=1 Tax=Erythrobacter crassostreae TaxID=2828328 RepID=A0A9X1F3B1_9SPHN|nr:serine hydrolase domain-containing protein [Erythrobacter crassostrea]MBV7258050.1 beta-lactamase family protein [Erythrobacter crassostrea]
MRKVSVFIIAVFGALQLGAPVTFAQSDPQMPRDAGHQDKIAELEAGLRPAYGIAGEDPTVWSLEERMEYHNVPGVSIAVAIDGKLAWAKAYGVADKNDGRPIDTETLFQAASLSKPVASLTGLALVQDGLLTLDAPVNSVLKRWQIPDNDLTRKQPVTLRHLMSHRAGTTIHGFRGYKPGDVIPTLPQILGGAPPANTKPVIVDQLPGARYRYSGGGYTVLQLAIEDAIGQKFSDVVEGRLFHPAGMTRSNFDYPATDTNIAIGHRGDSASSMNGNMLSYPELAAAGLWTTPKELLTLGSLVARARKSGNFILEAPLARQMVPDSANDAGLGFGLNDPGDGVAFVHSGHNPGYSARWINYADGRMSVVVLTNSDSGGALIREILSGLGDIYGWRQDAYQERSIAALNEEELASAVGRYAFDPDAEPVAVVTREGERLWIEGALVDRSRFLPQTASRFFVTKGLNFELERDGNGRVNALSVEGEIRLVKLVDG